MNLTALAVKRPVATCMTFIALSVLGAVSCYLLPVQLLPNLVFPRLRMVAWLPGASPEETEEKLVVPAEGAVAALEGVKTTYSSIHAGYASTVIAFDFGTDMRHAYLKLEQQIGAMRKGIPEQAQIQVLRFDTSDIANLLMQLVVSGPGDIDQLRNIADEHIVPALESVDGVVNVSAFGGKEYAVEVIADEHKCEALGVPLFEVAQTIAAFNRRTEYLGDVTDKGVRYFVSLTGRFTTIEGIRELPVGPSRQVRLKDVAEVRFGSMDADRISRIDGQRAVTLVVRKDSLANMLRVAKNVYRQIDELNEDLAGRGVRVRIVMDAADTVAHSIRRVEKLALFGVALALGVLLIFLKRLRTVAIVLVAMPVSLLVTFNVMYLAGLSINLLSLVGFAFAVGLLVDNSVVVIENTFRHAARAKDGVAAAIRGTQEVAMPIVAMTGTTLVAFLPVFFLVENEFRLIMEEFVYSIGSPLVVSVFVSLTLVPMLAARTIDSRVQSQRKHNRFVDIYVALLKLVLRHRAFTIAMTIVLFFFSLVVCLPMSLMMSGAPEEAGRVEYRLSFPRGTSIETASRLTSKLEEACQEFPDVKMVHSTVEPERGQVSIEFLDAKDRTDDIDVGAIRRQIEKRIETVEGLGRSRVQPIRGGNQFQENMARASMDAFGAPSTWGSIQVRGEDPEMLEKIALQIQQRLGRAFEDHMYKPYVGTQPGASELEIRGRRSILSQWGLTMADMGSAVWLARSSGDEQVVPFRTGDQDVGILVRLKDGKERAIGDLERMRLRTPDGQYVELAEAAEFKLGEASKQIVRRGQQHEINVGYGFFQHVARSATRLKALRAQVDEVIGAMQLPRGYTLKIKHEKKKDHSMRWATVAAVICVFLLLAALFEDLGTPLCVMATFPLATIGVLWGLAFTQTGFLNPMVWAGLIMLAGIVVNDAILTLGQARLAIKKGHGRTRAVFEGGRNRLRPVVMTTATTVLGMLPLAMRKGGESEIWPPFAIAVISGLIASTFFTLIFVPALYLSLHDIGRWLKSLGLWGLATAAGATAALFYFGFVRAGWVESWAWRTVLAPTVFFTAAAVLWMAIRAVTAARHVSVFQDEDVHISIRNVTKIFGEDSRVARDWNLKWRREAGMRGRGEAIVHKRHLLEDLVWKLPLTGLLIYFHFYFENPGWLFINACATWAALHDLVRTAGMLAEGDAFLDLTEHPSRWRHFTWRLFIRLPALAWAGYFYWALRAQLWLAILFFAVALALHWLHDLGTHARRAGAARTVGGKGPWSWIRNAALRIPVIAGVKPQVQALRGVNLEIGKGMFGLLGPNGAGKTTLMRILCNVYEPSRGCVEINGRDICRLRADVQPTIGYLPQHFGLYENFTVWDYLSYFALLNDIFDKDERETLVERVIGDVHLDDRKHDKIASLSGGMKQRVGIAQTLLHLPKIIVVDEPTAGLDPMERIRFRNLLAELGKDRIVIFSTHITEDVMSACHDLAVMDGGRVVFRGSPEGLQRLAKGSVREAIVDGAGALGLTARMHVISQVTEAQGVRVRFIVTDENEQAGEDVAPTLEDAYVYLLRTAGEPA